MEGSPSARRLPDRLTRVQITAATRRESTSLPMQDASTRPGHRAALSTALVPLIKIARSISQRCCPNTAT
jgi:hypothetical protein